MKAIWIPGVGCQITEAHNKILPAIFIYSMCFDFIVLLLNVYKLMGITSRDLMGRGRLPHIIFTDGLIFFILACVYISLEYHGLKEASLIQHSSFLSNFVATVFMVLNLNQIMSIIFNVPAAVISTVSTSLSEYVPLTRPSTWQIVACRAVRRLTNFTYDGPEII